MQILVRRALAAALAVLALVALSLPANAAVTITSSQHDQPAGVAPLTFAQQALLLNKLAKHFRAKGLTAGAKLAQTRANQVASCTLSAWQAQAKIDEAIISNQEKINKIAPDVGQAVEHTSQKDRVAESASIRSWRPCDSSRAAELLQRLNALP